MDPRNHPAFIFLIVLGLLLFPAPGLRAAKHTQIPPTAPVAPRATAPEDGWSLDFDSGLMWRVSGDTHLHYLVAAQIFSLRTPEHFRFRLGQGTVRVRARFSLLAEAILEGPESYYLGFAASPSIEYWFPPERTHLFFNIGGGVGWVDSQGVPGGQGQDLTLNWFMHAGLRHALSPRLSLTLGAYFQHLSNGGSTDPNPGLDTLGFTIGISQRF